MVQAVSPARNAIRLSLTPNLARPTPGYPPCVLTRRRIFRPFSSCQTVTIVRFDQWTNCHLSNDPDGAAQTQKAGQHTDPPLSLERFAKRFITGPSSRRTLSLPARLSSRAKPAPHDRHGSVCSWSKHIAPRFRPRQPDFDRCHLSPLRPSANSLRRSDRV